MRFHRSRLYVSVLPLLALSIVIGFLGERMPEREDGKTALGKPLSEQQQTARRRATITAVGAVTAM
jgi:hypothetical protein